MIRKSINEQDQESSWVSASQRGDSQAFNHIVLKWEKTVYNVAVRMLEDREEAAEATQDVFMLAFKNIRRFRNDSRFSTWLYRIVLNHCLSRKRQRPRGIHLSLDDENSGAGTVKEMRIAETQNRELWHSERHEWVTGALLRLPPDLRALVELKFIQEMTFDEVGAILEIPVSTVKSRVYSALELLKTRIGNRRGQL